jgi:hypothetical protein
MYTFAISAYKFNQEENVVINLVSPRNLSLSSNTYINISMKMGSKVNISSIAKCHCYVCVDDICTPLNDGFSLTIV